MRRLDSTVALSPLTRLGSLLLVLAALLLAAPAALAAPATTDDTTAGERTAEPPKYKLRTVSALAGAIDAMRTAQPKVARTGGVSAEVFRTSAVLLLAGDKARKAGDLALATRFGDKSVALLGGKSTSTLEQLKQDDALKALLVAADGQVPGGDGKVLTEAEWSKELEKE